MSSTQGLGLEDVRKTLAANYTDIVVTNWKVWPATQLVNFYFVPFQHRILVRKLQL